MKWSTRRSILWLYAWTALMAGTAFALRFIPYSERDGTLIPGWALLMGALCAVPGGQPLPDLGAGDHQAAPPARVAAAPRRPRHVRARHRRSVDHEFETGEFGQVSN